MLSTLNFKPGRERIKATAVFTFSHRSYSLFMEEKKGRTDVAYELILLLPRYNLDFSLIFFYGN